MSINGTKKSEANVSCHSLLNPYEDWEKTTRASVFRQQPRADRIGPWHPVYVKLHKGDGDYPYRESALNVINTALRPTAGDKRESGIVAIDLIGLVFLLRVFNSKNDLKDPDQFAKIFVWRPSKYAYEDEVGLFTVEFVGPESATLKVADFKNMSHLSAADIEGIIETFSRQKSLVPAQQVVTAVIDDQIGLVHERLRSAPEKSRIAAAFIHKNEIFDNATSREPEGAFVNIGGFMLQRDIDTQLKFSDELDIYRGLEKSGGGTDVIRQILGLGMTQLLAQQDGNANILREHRTSHGTFVADLAAGSHLEDSVRNRPIITFDLSRLATEDTSGTRLDVFALMGLQFVTGVAPFLLNAERPMVINLSFALQAGPKDGSGFFEREAKRLIDARTKNQQTTFLVLPSGNSYRTLGKARLSAEPHGSAEVEWRIQPGDQTPSYAEFWTEAVEDAHLSLTFPMDGLCEISLSPRTSIYDVEWNGRIIARIYKIYREGTLRVTLAVAPTLMPDEPARTAPAGKWLISLRTGHEPVDIEIDIQRDDTPDGYRFEGRQSYFDSPSLADYDPETGGFDAPYVEDNPVGRGRTISAYATGVGANLVVVGGAFGSDHLAKAALYSASGPDRKDNLAVDISAVTEESRAHPGRLAAGSMSSSSAVMSGTSSAAPVVTRKLVDALSGNSKLSKTELLNLILKERFPPDERLGTGTVPIDEEGSNRDLKQRRYRESSITSDGGATATIWS